MNSFVRSFVSQLVATFPDITISLVSCVRFGSCVLWIRWKSEITELKSNWSFKIYCCSSCSFNLHLLHIQIQIVLLVVVYGCSCITSPNSFPFGFSLPIKWPNVIDGVGKLFHFALQSIVKLEFNGIEPFSLFSNGRDFKFLNSRSIEKSKRDYHRRHSNIMEHNTWFFFVYIFVHLLNK